MPGYKGKRYHITFGEGEEFEGLELTCRGASLGLLLDLEEGGQVLTAVRGTPTAEQKQQLLKFYEDLAGRIVSWNVVSEGDGPGDEIPVKPDADGLWSRDFDEVMAIFSAYTAKVARVAPPLPQPSANGQDATEPIESLIPMSPGPSSEPG
jgi:hypothetical protein